MPALFRLFHIAISSEAAAAVAPTLIDLDVELEEYLFAHKLLQLYAGGCAHLFEHFAFAPDDDALL